MPNKYYHIHLICAPEDQVAMQDGLAIFMENRAFLTRDLSQGDHESASYSRRCIDKSDYIVMLVGDSYGKLNNTGVSQLHLSYIYAKTKAKPMLILIKLRNENETEKPSRQLLDFVGMVERDNSDSIYYYDEDVRMQTFIEPAYRKFIKENGTARGWTQLPETTNKILVGNTIGNIGGNTGKLPTIAKVAKKSNAISSIVADTDFADIIGKPEHIDEPIVLSFTTDAYQGGNLSEIELSASLSWREILQSVRHFSEPFSLNVLKQKVNELLNAQALALVQEIARAVHAVSRTRITDKDFQILQIQLIKMGWLKVVKDDESKQELLTLTNKAKRLL